MTKKLTFVMFGLLFFATESLSQVRLINGPPECFSDRARSATDAGIEFTKKGEKLKALAEFQRAVKAEPDCATVHTNLGAAYADMGRHTEALEAYMQALKFPTSLRWTIFYSAGRSFLALGQYLNAQKAYTNAIILEPKDHSVRIARARVNLILSNNEQAVSDTQAFLRLKGWRDGYSIYAAITEYLALRQSSQIDSANKIIDEAVSKLKKEAWPYPSVRFFNDEISEQQLLALADSSEKMTEARAYLGALFIAAGKTDEAKAHFNWVRDNGTKTFTEYQLALSRLATIEDRAATKQDK